jgi:hypothetical protein
MRGMGRSKVGAATACGTCAALLLIALPAVAQRASAPAAPPSTVADDSATSQARALFTQGTDSANRGDWSQALPAFERSEALRPHAVTTYNIGFCERALGRTMRARKMLGKALAESAAHGGVELPADLAASARTYLAELEKRIARAVVTVTPGDASILVDGAPLERGTSEGPRPVLWAGTRDTGAGEPAPAGTFELELDPGAHVFVASKEGAGNQVVTQTFQAGTEIELTLDVSPAAPSPSPVAAQAPPAALSAPPAAADTGQARTPSRVPLYVAIGVGAAGLATGVVSTSIALAQKSKVVDNCPQFTCMGAGTTALSRADTAADAATVGFIVAGVGAATAAVLWWLLPGPAPAPAAARLSPWVGPGGGGVSGTF